MAAASSLLSSDEAIIQAPSAPIRLDLRAQEEPISGIMHGFSAAHMCRYVRGEKTACRFSIVRLRGECSEFC
jgi:hypothetical protein